MLGNGGAAVATAGTQCGVISGMESGTPKTTGESFTASAESPGVSEQPPDQEQTSLLAPRKTQKTAKATSKDNTLRFLGKDTMVILAT